MATFNIYLKDNNSDRETPLFLYVRWNKNLLKYYIRESINPKYWELDKTKDNYQRAKRTKSFPEYPEFNSRLDSFISKAKDIFRRYQNDNDDSTPSVKELKALYEIAFKRVKVEKSNLFTFFKEFIKKSNSINSKKTTQWYENTLSKLREFSKIYNREIDFNTIDLKFYDAYFDFLSNNCEYKINTIGKHIQNLKAVLNESVERGLNTNLAFKSKRFKKPSEMSLQIHLNENEVEAMYQLDLSENKRLERVRDLFIVGCCTGLRYSDFSKIRKENIREGFINLNIHKTGQDLVIPIHPYVNEVMNKYSDNDNMLPKSISGDKMRKYLKEIGEKIPSLHDPYLKTYTLKGKTVFENIKKFKLIGTHTARRSFATNAYNDPDGVDTLTIMAITGHKTEKAFLTYIKTSPKEHAIKLKEHWNKKYKLRVVS